MGREEGRGATKQNEALTGHRPGDGKGTMFTSANVLLAALVTTCFGLSIGLINELVIAGDNSIAYAQKLNRLIRIEW